MVRAGGSYRRAVLYILLVGIPTIAIAACGGNPIQPGPGPIVQPPPPPPPPPPPGPVPVLGITKILAFGDSMTEGIDSPPQGLAADWTLPLSAGRSQSYPFKLKALIDARYTGQTIAVYNGGVGGRSARGDQARFSQALSEAGRPELVLLMEGANDFNSPLDPGEGINGRVRATVDALEDMIREASGRGTAVMVATLPPQRPPKGGGAEYVSRFNDLVRTMAANKGAQVVDIGSLPASLIGQDGLHPTEAGYARIAEIWFDAIKARFEREQ